MLQIKNVYKRYVTGDFTQVALNDVSVNFRDSEFVAILGQSGSGKTTLLNVIGGLDRYNKGDLIINNVSTQKYKDRDWDAYRNHSVGFVFQNYNLISHQSILSNVELTLTISGIGKLERRKRAKEALEKVGLVDQIHKKPNQLSGGQMQRVAIARALVNNPDILLADEPTGALDTKTSEQVMALLKEVAQDRLVIMVTHNPDLAERYATRIIKLQDGKITDDTNPYVVDSGDTEHKKMGKASMSLLTALGLSFNNLNTKKARTILTSFAGSIGIIGISGILALSSGAKIYIDNIQKDTMTSYPITIEKNNFDFTSMFTKNDDFDNSNNSKDEEREEDMIYADDDEFNMANKYSNSLQINNLEKFKEYLDDSDSEINKYISNTGIVYTYDTKFDVFTYDTDNVLINTNPSAAGQSFNNQSVTYTMQSEKNQLLSQLMPGKDSELISEVVTDEYEVVAGDWPEEYDEVLILADKDGNIKSSTLYNLGYFSNAEYQKITSDVAAGKVVEIEEKKLPYEEVLNKEFYLFTATDQYQKDANGHYQDFGENLKLVENNINKSVKLKVKGIIEPKKDKPNYSIQGTLLYTKALTDYMIDHTNNSEIVNEQKANQNVNVINGIRFIPANDDEKIADTKEYLNNMTVTEKANYIKENINKMAQGNEEIVNQYNAMPELDLAASFDQMVSQLDNAQLVKIYDDNISQGTYEENLEKLGVVEISSPSSINIYVDNFSDKEKVVEAIEKYNENQEEEDKIKYTDIVAFMIDSVNTIINVISYVLIAFVAISLVVSSIMIGIITYISVLERTKEIGILRAIGASKKNISRIFKAETLIIGFFSGLMGVGITRLLIFPANAIIHHFTDDNNINAVLHLKYAIFLIILSMILTLIGGLIPSAKAAKKDPVVALRTE